MLDLKSILKKHLGVEDKALIGFTFDELLKKSNALTGKIRRDGWADKTHYLEFYRPAAYEREPGAIRFFLCTSRSGYRTRYYLSAEDVAGTDWNFIDQDEVL